MTITGKRTKFGMEAWYLVPKRRLLGFVPDGVSLYTRMGLGTLVIGAWNHSNAYVDDRSYGPVLEAWSSIAVQYKGKLYGFVRVTYNNSPSYAEPVNNIFKFTKVQADIQWRDTAGAHEVDVRQNNKRILTFIGRPILLPKSVPFSRPRYCWLIKDNERYVAEMTISPRRSRLALTSLDIPGDSPWQDIASVIKWGLKYSVFYEDADIRIPAPSIVS